MAAESEIRNIKINDFDYPLPKERIALYPLEERDSCRLLVSRSTGNLEHHLFRDLPELLPEGTLMVCNNTKVINARMIFRKATGAFIEIFLLEPEMPAEYVEMFQSHGPVRWKCLVGNSKRWKDGVLTMPVGTGDGATLLSAVSCGEGVVELCWDNPSLTFASVVEAAGRIPIPPYLDRDSEESDFRDYQTVYSRVSGSVAAPTAGLHFTPALLRRLDEAGIERAELALHVGAGTFQPVKSDAIGGHPMHREHFTVTRRFVESLISAIEDGRKIAAVGTTSVRAVESLPYIGESLRNGGDPGTGQWTAYSSPAFDTAGALRAVIVKMEENGEDHLDCFTSIMIAPGFRWRIVDALVTNFHQPQSTLLLLVSSFLDRNVRKDSPSWKKIYDVALTEGYRFLSYGDACLFFPNENFR